jgi:CheY-like chemotaxis protein
MGRTSCHDRRCQFAAVRADSGSAAYGIERGGSNVTPPDRRLLRRDVAEACHDGDASGEVLTGKVMSARVLIVEDEFFIALDMGQQLADAGFEVVGPAPSVAKALSLVSEEGCDAAVLDVNLGGETSEPVARKLQESGKPFVVLSGYATDNRLPWFGGATVLSKPLRMTDLVAALRDCIEAASGDDRRM